MQFSLMPFLSTVSARWRRVPVAHGHAVVDARQRRAASARISAAGIEREAGLALMAAPAGDVLHHASQRLAEAPLLRRRCGASVTTPDGGRGRGVA